MKVRNFDHNQIRWCSMHTLNLGVLTWMVGSTLKVLLLNNNWAGGSEEAQLKVAFKEFSEWAKMHRVPCLP